jgi:hypothetical protein
MPEVSFPGDGHDGDQPPPAVPARDETAATPGEGPDDGRLPGAFPAVQEPC